ncbi:MAG: hypothetical protein JO035_02810 [Betaproteobacteria bacterium]|nr:hypothetical protein [Betaproteobacteria bacterium]
MKLARIALLLPCFAAAAPALGSEDDAFTHALTLVQIFVHAAAQSSDPQANLRFLDDVLAGRNSEANRAMTGLLEEATADLSPEHRDKFASIARDLAALARRDALLRPSVPDAASAEAALQARKDLNAMGLRYFDEAQFLDAVRRNDELAAALFVRGRGVSLAAKGPDGRTALDIARANRNERLAALLSSSTP